VIRPVLLGKKILIVDDGADNRLLLSMFLRRAGAEPLVCPSGMELLQTLEKSPTFLDNVDLILMDLQMPDLDGSATVQRLRQRGCCIPVIAISANTTGSTINGYHSFGIQSFLTKPIRIETLVEACQQVILSARTPTQG
jgi:two-component system CheB/CheR fusion protein